jgi:peptidoglycan/xylan/chitin deacetylase (PgdA/CDA1 family)
MNRLLTIVTYHYVRNLEHSRFPKIKGLTTEQFKEQIAYIKKYYNVIGGNDLLDAISSGNEIPPKALLLTFDDGYSDHFTEVFPILDREGITACFFPPAKCILEKKVLDVNKIHFILASVPNKTELVDRIFKMVTEYRGGFQLLNKDYYWNKLAVANRFDSNEVVFIKRMLQRELPEKLRKIIIDDLFREYVSSDEQAFSQELYMSLDQLRCLYRHSMYIGSHGYDHHWLDHLESGEQETEINRSIEFLRSITGMEAERWIMCYPYGAHNDSLLAILAKHGCKLGLTTEIGLADFNRHNPLTLPRLDTNDLPTNAKAKPNQWTTKIIE